MNLSKYTPSDFILDSKKVNYIDLTQKKGLTQQGREQGIRRLMSINLLKRLESSVYSFEVTLNRIKDLINDTINKIDEFEQSGLGDIDAMNMNMDSDFDADDQNTDLFTVGRKVKISLADMDYISWRHYLKKDAETLDLLSLMVGDITADHDMKLQSLLELISEKIENPINENNKKIMIFSAFADTAMYLYEEISQYVKTKYNLDVAVVTGSIEGRTTIKNFKASLNNVLTCYSPISNGKDILMPQNSDNIDILIATDCISEGLNLQDCDYLINYDIHWNPVRIIQRFGRIDRIGSRNDHIQLVNFWPDMDLDEYINLKSRVETRMKISGMTSSGDDDLINAEEKGDLEYRRAQLKRLQEEVVDIEDMTSGISIMDLGLNEFRLDLLEYMKQHEDIETAPKGLHTVVGQTEDSPAGVIFVLRNINDSVNIDNRNRIHPFYMVYISEEGEIVCDYLNPKKLLDTMRLLCRGKGEPCVELCKQFNDETDDGRKMGEISELLSEAINSIIDAKEENDIDSLFKSGGTSALLSAVSGLDDFELICFLVVKLGGLAMLGFPATTEIGKRIPKQKFYENHEGSPALRRVFVDQIRLVYWRNKLAASTLNIAAGEAVTEIEVFEVRLNDLQLDEAVLKQIDKEIPYHILFILTCDGKAQAWIGYKEAAASGSNAFKVSRYYHTDWMPEDELHLSIDGLNMDAVYESLVRQIAGDKLQTDSGESLKESVERDEKKKQLEKQIAALENKMRREKQLNRQMEMNAELKKLRKNWR